MFVSNIVIQTKLIQSIPLQRILVHQARRSDDPKYSEANYDPKFQQQQEVLPKNVYKTKYNWQDK